MKLQLNMRILKGNKDSLLDIIEGGDMYGVWVYNRSKYATFTDTNCT
jgi:hypothetical protein